MSAEERSSAVVPAVFDGELVDEESSAGNGRRSRIVGWWQRSRLVPRMVKTRAALRQAAADVGKRALLAPWWFVRSLVRGMLAGVRAWRQWITVHDYRDAAELSEKLADKFTEIRALTLFRWKVTGAVALAGVIAVAVAELVYGPIVWWIGGGLAASALAILGRRRDGKPGRKAVLAGPRALTWTMDPQMLIDAFRDAKLIGKDESLRLVERASRVGEGWAITVDLPATRKAADVIKNREALASALAVDEIQLLVEREIGRAHV